MKIWIMKLEAKPVCFRHGGAITHRIFQYGKVSLNRLDFQAVFFIETYQNVVIGLCQVIHNTVNIGFGIFRTVYIHMFVCGNMHGIRDAEMIPEHFVERRMFIDPQNLLNRHNGISIW